MKTKISLWGLLAGLLLFGAACSTDDTETIPDGAFQIAEDALSYDFEQGQQIVFIPVETNIPESEWKLSSSDDSWCKISKSYDNRRGLMLAVTESEEPTVREATVKAAAGSQSHEIKVRQLGAGPAILVSNKTLSAAGGDFTIAVTANIDYTVAEPVIAAEDEADWVAKKQPEAAPATRAYAKSEYSYFAQSNMLPFVRKATIAVTANESAYAEASTEITVSQNPGEAKKSDVEPDIQVLATGVTADDFHPGDDPDKLIDGNLETAFHSPWGYSYQKPTTVFPFNLYFTFDGTKDMDYIKIYHNAGGGNGVIGNYELYYKGTDAADWVPVKTGNLDKNKGGEKYIYFPSTLKGVTDLHLKVLDGAGNNDNPDNEGKDPEGFVSAKEMEFYLSTKGSINDAILKVFKDLSCSELNENVTREDITRLYDLVPYLAQEVAVVMQEGRYEEAEAEFRIHTYEPYSDTELYTKFLTKMYSCMDNPTGIEAKAGEEILVCVDKIPAGQYVSLAIYGDTGDGYEPNYGGANYEMELQAGLNVVKVPADRSGMCYVMNTTKQLSEASQPVRVHILRGCGTLQGYFDLARHQTDEKYAELLSKCTYKYFVVKGKHMMFNFHVSQLRKDAPTNILSGINAWDNILGWQLELMGLENVPYFNNHMMAVSTSQPEAYMDASHRRVRFSVDALYKIITYEQLIAAEDNTWGPSHELGHINQGAINWKSCSESSNNLFSNYIIYKMGKYGSRGDKLSELALNYALGKSWVLAGGSTHQNEDTELHMRMNWQLWNYFHRCGVNDQFWPTLFQLLRDNPMPSEFSGSSEDPGLCQLIFYQRACDAAQLDLTEFFDTWGFFVPVDIKYAQYGECKYKVTKEMIAEAKANVAAKGYAKAPAIQYIEDRNVKNNDLYCDMGYYTTFQNKTNITKSVSCKVEGRTYTASNNEEAVAIELRKPEVNGELGQLVYFSNMSSFTVPTEVTLPESVAIYAVQWDGKRVKVN